MKQKIKEFYHEEAREIPVIAEADVLVCGGGPAGVGAAITAARQGVKTMVIEKEDCLGGIATAGMMSHWGKTESEYITSRTTRKKSYLTKWQKKRAWKFCIIQAFAA